MGWKVFRTETIVRCRSRCRLSYCFSESFLLGELLGRQKLETRNLICQCLRLHKQQQPKHYFNCLSTTAMAGKATFEVNFCAFSWVYEGAVQTFPTTFPIWFIELTQFRSEKKAENWECMLLVSIQTETNNEKSEKSACMRQQKEKVEGRRRQRTLKCNLL